jgi:dTDP-4-amino-4,6-dideoxygalactose transaminase
MTAERRVPFSYLDRQFADVDDFLADVRELVLGGDFTLGAAVAEFEQRFASLVGMPHCVGVNSGTDAIALSLRALGVGPGDEVITAANTFVATAGAIVSVGARPVFVDNDEGFTIDPALVEPAITERTKAIVPVHYTGNVADMPAIAAIAERHGLAMVEDACQSTTGRRDDRPVGSWGATAAYSMHPLKNLNVWGDAGMITTRSEAMDGQLRLLRNHGLVGRDEVAVWGLNSRLDTLQAVVANRLVDLTETHTERRIGHAHRYDEALTAIDGVRVPPRDPAVRHVYHLYIVRVDRRDELLAHLRERGVEAKVHYPIPLHLQEASRQFGYGEGDFPQAERDAREVVTLPAHPYLSDDEVGYAIEQVRAFYGG